MNVNKIQYIFADIDGVVTDGKVSIDIDGNERKQICYRDLDAIGIGRKQGLEFFFITGEDTKMAESIAKRFNVKRAIFGAKDKLSAVKTLISELNIDKEIVCYIGDSDRDAPAIAYVGLGLAPADASRKALQAADFVTEKVGGNGVLLELVENIMEDGYRKD